jgi:hypothetical protein
MKTYKIEFAQGTLNKFIRTIKRNYKLFFCLVFLLINPNRAFAQDSIFLKPGWGLQSIIDLVKIRQDFEEYFPSSKPDINDRLKFKPVTHDDITQYISLDKGSDGEMYVYNKDARLSMVEIGKVSDINQLLYGMAIMGYLFKEFSDFYYFPNVISVYGFKIHINLFKNGYLQYEIEYNE